MKRHPTQRRARAIRSPTPAQRARGIAADLRECIAEAVVNRDDLREIARRLDAFGDTLEGRE